MHKKLKTIILITFCLIALIVGFNRGEIIYSEITVYPALCKSEPLWGYCLGGFQGLFVPTTYSVDKNNQVVYYKMPYQEKAQKYSQCVVHSTLNWLCDNDYDNYSKDYKGQRPSRKLGFVNGKFYINELYTIDSLRKDKTVNLSNMTYSILKSVFKVKVLVNGI